MLFLVCLQIPPNLLSLSRKRLQVWNSALGRFPVDSHYLVWFSPRANFQMVSHITHLLTIWNLLSLGSSITGTQHYFWLHATIGSKVGKERKLV